MKAGGAIVDCYLPAWLTLDRSQPVLGPVGKEASCMEYTVLSMSFPPSRRYTEVDY